MKRAAVLVLVPSAVVAIAWGALADPPARLVRPEADAGAEAGPPPGGWAPDPVGMVTRHQWILDLRYASGDVALRGTRRIELARPTPTPRVMGRFAVELYIGRELLDRVRFDFPLLGADDFAGQKRPWNAPPSFERGLTSTVAIMVPHSERATRAVLVDRATGKELALPWPFDSAPADGGTRADAAAAGASPADAATGD